ncbi:MAG: anaerobic ribonucleoside triphosphate reductase [Defluviitaleaceae bacterium]|nr:anaerobic ribonucleoside triphosphate reductase [Defluviitaleaceae bacterium]MCL2262124.1 anaerobic ribonucleoside triphosphate reductase [Defluviitaleaceae bacterium]
MQSIIKRDNVEVPFDTGKIAACIDKAFDATGGYTGDGKRISFELALNVLKKLEEQFADAPCTVENVQDLVETVLIEGGHSKVAKAYILYRQKRTAIREARSELMDAVAEIVRETNRDNANVGNSPSAKVLQISEAASKSFYLKRVIPAEESSAHLNGDIYIQDLSWYGKTLTCLQIPLDKLLVNGFNNGHGSIRSPKNIRSATALAAIILQSNQNDMHGGQSFGFFDRDMAPFVEIEYARQEKLLRENLEELKLTAPEEEILELVDKHTRKETYQAMEAFIYNLNTMHSRAGAQVPFSSINLGTDTSRAGRMVTECFLRAYERGLGKGETPIFPNLIFKLKYGINFDEGDPNYDLFHLAMKVACKRLFPTFSFLDATFNNVFGDEEVCYMGCRTRVIGNINGAEVTNGRGNLSFTSINLPRLGIRAGNNLGEFYRLLDKTMEKAVQQLLTRYNLQKNLRVKDFPFLMGQKLYVESDDLKPNDPIEKAIKHGTLSIGFIGLAECLVALTGSHHGEDPGAQAQGVSIVRHMRAICDEASQKHGLNFSLLATPAEQLSGKFVAMDLEKYGKRKGITDKKWYTNSFHVPVECKITALEKIAIEGPYHVYCNAGHISYVELASAPGHNIEAYEKIIRAMAEADMGYGAVNFPLDICRDCGTQGLHASETCPACGSTDISRVRRITGYLSTLDRFNDYKLAEEESRIIHTDEV